MSTVCYSRLEEFIVSDILFLYLYCFEDSDSLSNALASLASIWTRSCPE